MSTISRWRCDKMPLKKYVTGTRWQELWPLWRCRRRVEWRGEFPRVDLHYPALPSRDTRPAADTQMPVGSEGGENVKVKEGDWGGVGERFSIDLQRLSTEFLVLLFLVLGVAFSRFGIWSLLIRKKWFHYEALRMFYWIYPLYACSLLQI